MKKKKIAADFLYCVGAVGMMNAVLQLIVYPVINNRVGENEFGNMLFLLGILNILAPSFGQGTANARLVMPERETLKNKEYILTLGIFSIISAVISGIVGAARISTAVGIVMFVYIIVMSIYRMYACVEYRLSLEFKRQFVFYLALSIGYILGLLIFWKSEQWYWVFILGETIAVLYVFLTGNVLRHQSEKTEERFSEVFKSAFVLSASYLLTNILLNLDRFILAYMIDSEAVSQYYVNSILIGYITKGNQKIKTKSYLKGVGLLVGFGLLALVACSIVTPIYIKILYPNLYEAVVDLNVLVNVAQIFYFLTNVLLVIILTMCEIRWQFVICGISDCIDGTKGIIRIFDCCLHIQYTLLLVDDNRGIRVCEKEWKSSEIGHRC